MLTTRMYFAVNTKSGEYPGITFGKKAFLLWKPEMGQLEAHCFQTGVVILHLPYQFLLRWGKPLDSGVDGFLGSPYLGEGGKVVLSVKLLVVRMEPELVYRVTVAVQIPASALSGHIQELGPKLCFQGLRKSVIGEPRCGLVVCQLFLCVGMVNLGQSGIQLLYELYTGYDALCK